MAVGYPPIPVYPNGIDNDYTLFLVYNTTESALAEDNDPWAEEIPIVPRTNTQSEIWANNGFANINGELLYYDSVDKDANGKVCRLKRCARHLSGAPTQFNAAGTMVRGFVVAEHHNQLVNAIILSEKFIGYNFTTDESTLDWRIRNLQAVPIIFDDFGCPDIIFHWTVVSSDPSAGTVINYSLDVIGSYNQFVLSFGDGSSTSSIQEGTHTYAPNANIDPVVTFTNQNCQIVQTPFERDSVDAPQSEVIPTSFQIPNLPAFTFPTINVNTPSFPEANITIPPFQFPCIDLSPLGISPINIPSVIMVEPPINLPSVIDFEEVNIPSFIGIGQLDLPSIITIIGPDIPSVIVLTQPDIPTSISINSPNIPTSISINNPNIPSQISLVVPTIPNISLEVPTIPNISLVIPTIPNISLEVPTIPNISLVVPTIPNISLEVPTIPNVSLIVPPIISVTASFPLISVNWNPVPILSMNWATPPTITVDWTPVPAVAIDWGVPPILSIDWDTPPMVSMNWGTPPTLSVNWGTPPTINVNVTVTCPSTPLALAATDRLGMTDDMLGIGKDLQVEYDVSGFPSEIKIIPPEIPDVRVVHDVPSEIMVKMPSFPNLQIEVPELRDIRILPPETQLTIEAIGIPDSIKLVPTSPIPERIELWMPVKIPEVIRLEHDIPDVIRIEGLPDIIRLEHDLPSVIRLEMPEKPEIELVYKGSPIPVQVQLDIQKLVGDADNLQCVAIVPCPRR